MPDRSVTLPMLEAYLATRRKRVAFPPAIEAFYNREMDVYHKKVMSKGILPILVVYNAFLLADFLLTAETFLLAVILHLAVVTPTILLVAYLYPKTSNLRLRNAAVMAIPLLMVAQILYIFTLNQGPGAEQYQYLVVLVVIYKNVNLRFGYQSAVASTLVSAVAYWMVLLTSGAPLEVKFIGFCMMAAGGYLSLVASRRMELDLRYNFLVRTRDKMLREGAEEVAKRDALTGLANRRKLEETVEALWTADVVAEWPVAAVMVDIDHFKAYNDRYGHSAGDVCLKRVAGVISAELRDEQDLAVRMGGEEFLLLLPGANEEAAMRVAERVRREIRKIGIPHEHFGPRGVVTASLGVAAAPVSAISFDALCANADASLYAAKNNGRNQVRPHSEYDGKTIAPLRNKAAEREEPSAALEGRRAWIGKPRANNAPKRGAAGAIVASDKW